MPAQIAVPRLEAVQSTLTHDDTKALVGQVLDRLKKRQGN
jgi:hypothetical protein